MKNGFGVIEMKQRQISYFFKWILFKPVVPGSPLITVDKFYGCCLILKSAMLYQGYLQIDNKPRKVGKRGFRLIL
jgi:hypothetical protein